MARLGETVADLVRRGRPAAGGPPAALPQVQGFGSNPGALVMRLHTPADLCQGAPLVVALHGCGQTAEGYAHGAGWIALADRCGFAVLAPEQTRANNAGLCFNWFQPPDVARDRGEAASIAQMVGHALAGDALDSRRVFVTGLSAGGAMAAAMLAAYPELFAAGAVVAGLPYGAATTVQEAMTAMRAPHALSARAWGDKVRDAAPGATAWPPIAIWHGNADSTVAPGAADALVLQWTDVHGVEAATEVATGVTRHRRRVWRGALGEPLVERNDIAGMGHGTPLAVGGDEGCGAAGPYLLEVGVSSSLLIARSWGIAAAAVDGRTAPHPAGRPAPEAPRLPVVAEVGEVISRALKGAGLLR